MHDAHQTLEHEMPLLAIADFLSAPRSEQPLNDIVAFAADYFAVDYVHIALIEGAGDRVRIRAAFLDGSPVPAGEVYALPGTPCEHVMEHDHKCYAEHVQTLFPEDKDLLKLGAEGYIGEPVISSEGDVVGLVVLVSRHKLFASGIIASSLRILSTYIGSLLSEEAVKEAMREERDQAHRLMDTVETMIISLDREGRIRTINRKGCEILGYAPEALAGKEWFATCLPPGEQTDRVRDVYRMMMEDTLEDVEYFENSVLTRDGEERLIAWHNSLLRDHSGAITGSLSAGMDITEQKALSEAIRREKERYQQMMRHASEGVIVYDAHKRVVEFSDKACELLGYDEAEMRELFVDDFDVIFSDEQLQKMQQEVMNGDEMVFETVHRRKDGTTYHAAVTAVMFTLDGEQYAHTTTRDISELVEAREKLRESHDRMEAILQTTGEAYLLVDKLGGLIDVNNAVCEMLGYPRETLLQMGIAEIDAQERPDDVIDRLERIAEAGSVRFEAQHRHRNGSLVNVDVSVTYLEVQDCFVVFIRDITEQKARQRELEHQRGFLRTLLDTIPDLVWLKNAEGRYLACNAKFEALYGVPERELLGKTDYDFVDRETAEFFRRHDELAIEQGSPRRNLENLEFASDGHIEITETMKIPMYDVEHRLIGVLGVGHDISEKQHTELLLRESEKSFRSLFDSLKEAVYVQNEQGMFLVVNEGASLMYGYPREWFIGKHPQDVAAPGKNDLEDLEERHSRVMLFGEPQSFEFWGRKADGTLFPKEVHQTRGTWFGREVVFTMALEITERKQHEAQLEHLAHFDALTGLPNRLLLADRLKQAMATALRHQKRLAIAYLDLDGFKEVNDAFGHETGDRLLIEVATRTQQALRDEDTLARLGGDEFVTILGALENEEDCIPVLERILERISAPRKIHGKEVRVSVSIGVTFFPRSDRQIDADQLVRQADQAMYRAKKEGKNRYRIFGQEE